MAFAPLILTLALDGAASATLDLLRKRHFPPDRNHIPAHITLFHHLLGERRTEIEEVLGSASAGIPMFDVVVAGVRPLGRGTALDVGAVELPMIRADLAARFAAWLTAQDRQGFRPHVTIQNKVDPAQARTLQVNLEALPPIAARAQGLDLWHYRGGPWKHARRFAFAA